MFIVYSSPSYLQVVREFSEEEAKAEKAARLEYENTDLLF